MVALVVVAEVAASVVVGVVAGGDVGRPAVKKIQGLQIQKSVIKISYDYRSLITQS